MIKKVIGKIVLVVIAVILVVTVLGNMAKNEVTWEAAETWQTCQEWIEKGKEGSATAGIYLKAFFETVGEKAKKAEAEKAAPTTEAWPTRVEKSPTEVGTVVRTPATETVEPTQVPTQVAPTSRKIETKIVNKDEVEITEQELATMETMTVVFKNGNGDLMGTPVTWSREVNNVPTGAVTAEIIGDEHAKIWKRYWVRTGNPITLLDEGTTLVIVVAS